MEKVNHLKRQTAYVNCWILLFVIPWRVNEEPEAKCLKNFQEFLYLNRALAVLQIGNEPYARSGDAGELHLGDALTLALRFYQLPYFHDSFLLFMLHVFRLLCFTER